MFNSGDRIKDLYKHLDILPSFGIVIIQIGSNDTPRDTAAQILKNMQTPLSGNLQQSATSTGI